MNDEELLKLTCYTTQFNHELMELNIKYSEEIERLKNNWNKLKQWVKEESTYSKEIYRDVTYRETMECVLYEIKKLEGSDKE